MVKLKILQVRLQQYVNWELPDAQAEFRKGRGTRDQIANICWIIKKNQEHSRKISSLVSLTALRPLILWVTTSCGKYLKRWKFQTTLPASWESCVQVKKQQLELDMERWSGSKLGKEDVKAVCCHPAYLTSMQSASWEIWDGGLTSWSQDCQVNINKFRYAEDTTLMVESKEQW